MGRRPAWGHTCTFVPVVFVWLDISLVIHNPIWSERFSQPSIHWINIHWIPTRFQALSWALGIQWATNPESHGLHPHGVYLLIEEPEDTYNTQTIMSGGDKMKCYEERGLGIFYLPSTQRQFYSWTYPLASEAIHLHEYHWSPMKHMDWYD